MPEDILEQEVQEVQEEVKDVEVEATETGTETETQEVKTYTEEEVAKRIQSEADRRVQKALETARAKWEAESLAKSEEEAERIRQEASMTEEEKYEAKLAEERAAFEAERAEFFKAKLEAEAVETLAKEGINVKAKQFVLAEDSEDTLANIQLFKEILNEAIKDGLKGKLETKQPKKSNVTNAVGISYSEFTKLPYKERQRLQEKDPDIMSKLK